MLRLSRLFSLVLLALWLPATQHCALEAAGVIGSVCHSDRGAIEQPCADDACSSFESALYQTSLPATVVLPPGAHDCVLLELLRAAESPAPHFPCSTVGRPLDWVVTWHFVQRAAPPSRAPTRIA